jgi:hypothetical protein
MYSLVVFFGMPGKLLSVEPFVPKVATTKYNYAWWSTSSQILGDFKKSTNFFRKSKHSRLPLARLAAAVVGRTPRSRSKRRNANSRLGSEVIGLRGLLVSGSCFNPLYQ